MRRLAIGIALGFQLAHATSHALTVRGVVQDSAKNPVANARVWLTFDDAVHTCDTDSDGTFLFENLRPGSADLVIYKEGFALGGISGPLFQDEDLAWTLTEPAPARLKVVGADYAPIPGARLRYFVLDDALLVRAEVLMESGLPSVRSDDDGVVTIPWARKGGFVSAVVSHSRYADEQMPYLPAGIEPLSLILNEGGTVSGRVTTTGDTGAAQVLISVFPAAETLERIFTTTRTDADGFYRIRLPVGLYRLRASHPDYASPTPSRAELRHQRAEIVVDLQLAPPRVISGRVIDGREQGMPGIHIGYWRDGLLLEQTFTDSEGAYQLTVAQGEGTIHATAPAGYMRESPADVQVKIERAESMTVSPIQMRSLPVIRGSVVDRNGKAVEGALVSGSTLREPVWQLTGSEGRFQIQLNYEPDDRVIELSVEHPRLFERAPVEVHWRRQEDLAVQLSLFTPDQSPPEPDRYTSQYEDMRGEPAPVWACTEWFNLPVPEGADAPPTLNLDALAGRVVVLTLWGGFDNAGAGYQWIQQLNLIHAMFRDDDQVAFVAIHDGVSEPDEIAAYVKAFGIQYPVGVDGDMATFDSYDTNAIPQTFLIDKRGVLRYYGAHARLLELIKALRIEGV